MTTVVTKFSTGGTKLQASAAAVAIATAAVFTPAAIAGAKPDLMPATPMTEWFSTDMFGTDPILGPVQLSQDTPWWWLGDGPNPNASVANAGAAIAPLAAVGGTPFFVFEFTPLAFVPGFLQPLVGWFLNLIPQFNVCILGGLGVSVGPYGKLSVKVGGC
jgi:hypothetical protein